jgi:hypothetical protein
MPTTPDAPTPTAAHRALDVLVGRWVTRGAIHATADAPAAELHAIDVYEWLPGGFFLLHTADALLGDAAARSIEVIGHDAARGCYVTRSYDDRGGSEEYTARLVERAWEIDGASVRFRGALDADGAILAGRWERCDDAGAWVPWMDIELRKVAGGGR